MLPPQWELSDDPLVDFIYSLVLHENKPGARTRRYNIAFADGTLVFKDFDQQAVLREFAINMKVAIGMMSPLYVFVHAGVVDWNGHLIMLPADGTMGKSTLVTALVRAGARYYSDEIALIDEAGTVRPYHTQIGKRIQGFPGIKERFSAEEIGGTSGTEPMPISMVISTHYKEGAVWRPRKQTLTQGVMTVFDNTFSAHRNTERALNWIKGALSSAELLHGSRGEAEQVVQYLRKRYGDPPRNS